jgi:hypothetical protein
MATNFLQAAGSHGFIVTPVTVMTTELNTLANNTNAISSVGGTSGVFTQTNFGNAIWAEIEFIAGGAMSGSPAAGGYLAGWWLFSEAGATFEKVLAGSDLPRSPDFTLPLLATAYAASDITKASGLCRLPAYDAKLYIANHSGVSLNASGNIIKVGPVATQY